MLDASIQCRSPVPAPASSGVGRWVDIAAVGERLGLDLDRAIVLADDCEQAGWARHDRSHMPPAKRGAALPHSVTLSDAGWELMQSKARTPRR
jgi:hypothetical protein